MSVLRPLHDFRLKLTIYHSHGKRSSDVLVVLQVHLVPLITSHTLSYVTLSRHSFTFAVRGKSAPAYNTAHLLAHPVAILLFIMKLSFLTFIVTDIFTVKIFPLRLHPARHLVSYIIQVYYTSTCLRPQLTRHLPTKMQATIYGCRTILQESIMFPYYIQHQYTSALFTWRSFDSSLARNNTRI